MSHVTGTYKSGLIELHEPVDWPDGTSVEVACPDRETCLDGSIWPQREDEVADWLRWFDARQPMFTNEEYVQFEADREAARVRQKELAEQESARLGDLFKR